MKSMRILIPVLVTVILTVAAVFSAIWLTGLVPDGAWSELIKAAIVIFIIGATLVIIAWSAYFSYIIRDMIEKLVARKD